VGVWLVSVEVKESEMKKQNKKAKKITLDLEILELEAKIAPATVGQKGGSTGAEC
jgi:hypothetical protein